MHCTYSCDLVAHRCTLVVLAITSTRLPERGAAGADGAPLRCTLYLDVLGFWRGSRAPLLSRVL